jgi:hypothetical protein
MIGRLTISLVLDGKIFLLLLPHLGVLKGVEVTNADFAAICPIKPRLRIIGEGRKEDKIKWHGT